MANIRNTTEVKMHVEDAERKSMGNALNMTLMDSDIRNQAKTVAERLSRKIFTMKNPLSSPFKDYITFLEAEIPMNEATYSEPESMFDLLEEERIKNLEMASEKLDVRRAPASFLS
jgi:hypothetical protein